MVRTLLLTFIPLFVAVDVVALVFVYLGIGMPLDQATRRRLVLEATMDGCRGRARLPAGCRRRPVLSRGDGRRLSGCRRRAAAPAALTTLLTLARTYGYTTTLIAFALNLAIVWAALRWASVIGRVLGDAGRAISKVLSLVLAAIGVTFVRRGVMVALATP